MPRKPISLIVTVVLLPACLGSLLWACGGYGEPYPEPSRELVERLAELAIRDIDSHVEPEQLSVDAEQLSVIAELRSRGPDALAELLRYHDEQIAKASGQVPAGMIQRLEPMIDKVAGQRFASQSRLYWHTSLSDAQREAALQNRPILSLRMLGRLDEDLSCANSRFFRTTLYPDAKINKLLSEQFVLHWQSVRDVPVVTIDFGEGRQLRRPLTGNSVHLVLNPSGQPIDALPGLVSPDWFVEWLDQSHQLFRRLDSGHEAAYWSHVADYHRQRAKRRRSESEMAIAPDQSIADLNPLDRRWAQLAKASPPVRLAASSHSLLNRQQPPAALAMPTTALKMVVELPLLRAVEAVGPHIARDSVFNRYALQTKIDDWFASRPPNVVGYDAGLSYDALTNRIYSDVFLMSLSDPWLGLSNDSQYVALDNGGRLTPQTEQNEPSEQNRLPTALLNALNQ